MNLKLSFLFSRGASEFPGSGRMLEVPIGPLLIFKVLCQHRHLPRYPSSWMCGHQSPRCLHPVSPRISPCCCSILFLGTEVICQAQDLFCCFYFLPGYWTVDEQHLSECCLRGNLPRLSPPELSEIYVLTAFFQTLCLPPPREISKGEEMMSEQPVSLNFLT